MGKPQNASMKFSRVKLFMMPFNTRASDRSSLLNRLIEILKLKLKLWKVFQVVNKHFVDLQIDFYQKSFKKLPERFDTNKR